MRKIYYFTTYYPNRDVSWKTDELKILSKHFDIEVVPFENKKFEFEADKIENITYPKALFDVFPNISIRFKLFRVLFSKFVFKFKIEMLRKKVFLSKTKLILWTEAAYKILLLTKNKRLREVFKNANAQTIFYFYWGRETSEVIGFLNTKAKIIVRYHGYDLYEERNNNYIPFRTNQLKNLDYAVFISQNGERYLKEKYPKINFDTKLSRLGTTSFGLATKSDDGVFRIISCARIIPLKRIDLIAKAVKLLKFNVEWTHIGSGEDAIFNDLKQLTEDLSENIKINLVGEVASNEVHKFYVNKNVDLFINASTTEGLPVSVMEAMAAGIPVLATNVGGTSELVHDKVGSLLKADLDENYLADEITKFKEIYSERAEYYRQNSYQKYKELVDFKVNTGVFKDFLNK